MMLQGWPGILGRKRTFSVGRQFSSAFGLPRTLLDSETRVWTEAPSAFTLTRATMLTTESPTMYGARVTPNAPWDTARWLRDKTVVWTITGADFPVSPATPFGGIYSEARQVGFQAIALLRTAATYTITATVTWESSGIYYYCRLTDEVTTTAPTYAKTLRMVASSPGADEYTDLTTLLEDLEGLNRNTFPRVKVELQSGVTYNHTLSRQAATSDERTCAVNFGERTDFVTYGGSDVAEIVHPSNWISASDTNTATAATAPLQFRDAGTVSFTNIRINGGYNSTAPGFDGANTCGIREVNTSENVQFIFDACRFRGLHKPILESSTQNQILGAGLLLYAGYFNCQIASWYDFGIFNNSASMFAVMGCVVSQTPGTALVGERYTTGDRYVSPYAIHGPVRSQTDILSVVSHNQLISRNGWFCYDGDSSGNDNTLLSLPGYESYTPTAEQLKNVSFQPCLRALQGTHSTVTTANLVVAFNEMQGGDAVAYFGIQENGTEITATNNVQVIANHFVAPAGSDRFIDIGVPIEFIACEFTYLTGDPIHNLRAPTDHVFGTTKTITEDTSGNPLPDGLTGTIGLSGCTVNAINSRNNGSEVLKSDPLSRIPNLTVSTVNMLELWKLDDRTDYVLVQNALWPRTGADGTVDGGTVTDIPGQLRPAPPSNGAREVPDFIGALDGLTASAAAYSMRRLSMTYTGPLIRVRRSFDNTEADIGFTASGDLDTVALLAFVQHGGPGPGNEDGFVTTWYDQSGNGRHATQTTAANQPRIVDAGVLEAVNGRPALRYLGSQSLVGATALPNVEMVFSAVAPVGSGVMVEYCSGGDNLTALRMSSSTRRIGPFGERFTDFADSLDESVLRIYTDQVIGSDEFMRRNGQLATVSATDTILAAASPVLEFGSRNASGSSSLYFSGQMCEYVFFELALSDANRQNLEAKMQTYWGQL